MNIGLVLPQRGASWNEVKESALRAEELGCDSLWVIDHLLTVPAEKGLPEAWTVLSALAAITSRVELGAQVFCQSFRNPALLAKMAATLDDVSNQRFRLLIGAGWYELEYRAFGFDFPAPGTLVEELQETVEILRGMLSSTEPFTFDGKHYRVKEVVNAPLKRSIPIEIGGARNRMLRTVARLGDGWNSPAMLLGGIEERVEFLREQCEKQGRKIDDLRLSCQIPCAIGDEDLVNDPAIAFYMPTNGLWGSVEQATSRAKELMSLGFTDFNVVIPPGERGWDSLALLLNEVRPALT